MTKLAVDPQALSGAGAAAISAGDGIAAAVGPLTAGFGANTGEDTAGEVFGLKYQDAGKSLLQTVATGINACRNHGYKVELGAFNYSRADAGSTLGGGAATLPAPTEPGKFDAPGAPWTLGPGVPPPALWAVVEMFVGDLWPNGNPAQMHTAAGCWRTFGGALRGVKGLLSGPISVITAQQMPESGAIHNAFSKLGDDMAKLGDECDKVANSLDDFADKVQQTQGAIRDLLHRLGSASGLWNEAMQVLTGHGLDEVKKIANDIKVVLHHLGEEAEARAEALQLAVQEGDALLRGLQKDVRSELVSFFGADVGNPLATLFDTITNIDEGLIKSVVLQPVQLLEELNPMRALSDPKGTLAIWEGTAKGLGEMLLSGMPGGDAVVDALDPSFRNNMSRQLLHLDDWSTARPGLGAGENLGDLLMLFIPGLGEAGAAGRGVEIGGEVAEAAGGARAAGRGAEALGEASEVAGVGGALGDVTKTTSGLTKDLEGLGTGIPKDGPAPGRPVGLPPGEPPAAPMPPRVEPAPPRVDPPPPVTSRPPADVPSAPSAGAPARTPVSPPAERPATAPPIEAVPAPHPPTSPGELPPGPPQSAPPTPAEVPHAPASPAPAPTLSPPDAFTPPHDVASQLPGHGLGPADHPGTGDPLHHGPHDSMPGGGHDDAPLSPELRDEILAMEKGSRPDPSEYLSPEYIQNHLDKFHDGAARFMPESNFDKFGIAQRDGTSFVMPKHEADALIDATRGDPRALERSLGLPEGFLNSRKLVRIDIDHPDEFNLRMPSGNEAGANEQWIPGGLLPDGAAEAIVDGGNIPKSDYSVTEVTR
jgi:hypothetical protein